MEHYLPIPGLDVRYHYNMTWDAHSISAQSPATPPFLDVEAADFLNSSDAILALSPHAIFAFLNTRRVMSKLERARLSRVRALREMDTGVQC